MTEKAETEKEKTEPAIQKHGIYRVFMEQLEQLKQHEANETGITVKKARPTKSNEPEAAREFMTEINRLTEEAETKSKKTEPAVQKQGIFRTLQDQPEQLEHNDEDNTGTTDNKNQSAENDKREATQKDVENFDETANNEIATQEETTETREEP
ncbi:hypothetical protein CYMTET_21609 [Cymbomonas tetramitiformis]|uniref:Uncharacterized protein n=1 Tax=Cymbomonas tetramitiformis TaxID=36881 RepID=A0AAE0G2H5_9CHLO|nr:hypothetical protein CYMTET_21609 [Cymbomonas tetramitiformis]